jgi:hypothetical protein
MCSGLPGCGQRHPEDFDCGQKWATEHAKLKKTKAQSDAVSVFLDWLLYEKRYAICEPHTHTDDCYEPGRPSVKICGMLSNQYFPVMTSIEKLLAEHFEIDLKKLSEEKDRMLEELKCQDIKTGRKDHSASPSR